MSKIKKPKAPLPPKLYATFFDLAKAWQLRCDNLRFAGEHAAANQLESAALEMSSMAGIDMIRPTMIAYAWKDISGAGGIKTEVGFRRPMHVPADAITVLHGPAIPEQDMVTGANIKPVDTRRVDAILKELEEWRRLQTHWFSYKTEEGNGKGAGINEAIAAVEKIILKIKDTP